MNTLMSVFVESLRESLTLTLIIFILMIAVELLVLKYKERLVALAKGKLQYALSALFGIIPGCIGTFAMDSLYMAGLLTFGGVIAVMVATSGDEAFLMLSLALQGKLSWLLLGLLTALLFLIGIVSGWLSDRIVRRTKMRFCEKCAITYHKEEFQLRHFLKEHILNHILAKHLWKIFLWVFAALFTISLVAPLLNHQALTSIINPWLLLVIASLLGILPISGQNAFLVVLFSQGALPFSILLANSIIQDGHGLLPIMGFSMDDAVKIKAFNLVIGLAVGALLLALGL